MIGKKLFLTKLIFFFYFLYFVKTSSVDLNNDVLEKKEVSNMDINNPLNHLARYEGNITAMEERMKYLSETFNQLEIKFGSLIKEHMDVLENTVHYVIEEIVKDKLAKIDQIIEEKLKSINNIKKKYNVQKITCSNNRYPTNCYDLNECNNNIYSIMVPEFSDKPFSTVCDLKTLNGGWTVIQRRQDGSENFYRNWNDYVEGFGDMEGEFFIGLEKLYALTSLGEPQELYIILEDFEGERRYARYGEFKVDSNTTEYKLTVSKYSGDAGDCFSQHNGHMFSTRDRDNDVSSTKNCAERFKAAWWYTDCFYSNLNGLYMAGKTSASKRGVSWCHFRNYDYSLKFVQMMIRNKED